ncbi:hypothetical protein AMAG_04026 [Allomyces macrogynus ATCC 38327]|uniref:G-protein coupled receptors family 1 profile domain-containing protein n=1 Tax=Allomyces macrogynus (strain ATCC 38327) TaxID=578462 RepID=A0A0L0S7S4_ALLM3|nr:hypothetical protein AMAG_04026 [Allomyces macrogynus ATCC 38327]|eukprot:KNE58455.1 hypothetical protein AMAG_04026 [Allomyces macrogynus ATCC 38327]
MGWFYDPNNLSDQLRAFSLFLHFCGIIAILVSLKECVPQAVKGRQVFWIASTIACLFLLATSLLEIVYTLTRISQFTWFPWPRITSIGGDITVRLGYAILTTVRFWRLRAISPFQRQKYFPYATAIVWIVLLVSLGCVSAVRVLEQKYGNRVPVPEDLVSARQGEQVLSFIAFLIVQLFNLAVDVLFYQIIAKNLDMLRGSTRQSTQDGGSESVGASTTGGAGMAAAGTISSATTKSAKKATSASEKARREVILSFLPPVAVDIAYLIALIFSMISANAAGITHMVVTLNRFAPTVEAVIFFVFSIKQTRKLVRSNDAKSGSGRSQSQSALAHGSTRASTSVSASASASAMPMANVRVAAAGAQHDKIAGGSFMAAEVKKPL